MKNKLYTFAEVIPKLLKGQVVRRTFKRMDSAKYYYFMAEHWGSDWLYCYNPSGDRITQFSGAIYIMAKDLKDKMWSVVKDKNILAIINKVRNGPTE